MTKKKKKGNHRLDIPDSRLPQTSSTSPLAALARALKGTEFPPPVFGSSFSTSSKHLSAVTDEASSYIRRTTSI